MNLPDLPVLIPLAVGALAAGFVNGFSGFGVALVASGFWFLVVHAHFVPPLVVVAGLVAQAFSLIRLRQTMRFRAAMPMIFGGLFGVPLGVVLLGLIAPDALRLTVGVFLVAYTLAQLGGLHRQTIGAWGGRAADAVVGFIGGVFGGFAGLAGPLPVIWVQLRGVPPIMQRSHFQPFNSAMALLALIGMFWAGHIGPALWPLLVVVMPLTLIGAMIGVRCYHGVGDATMRAVIFAFLLVSGIVLIGQAVTP